jgi:hypothetical protein
MSRRRQTETESHTGAKFLFLLAVILLAVWAGHDPAGALAALHAFGNALSGLASHAKDAKK